MLFGRFGRKPEIDCEHAHAAVLLIDMQTSFVEDLDPKKVPGLIKRQLAVLRKCCELDIPCVTLELRFGGDETIQELASAFGKVPRQALFIKDRDDGFYDTALHQKLQEWQVSKLVLMGINANFCVRATAKSAIRLGYQIITSPGLIAGASYHSEPDLRWYEQNGKIVTDPF